MMLFPTTDEVKPNNIQHLIVQLAGQSLLLLNWPDFGCAMHLA
jgi:hypothetical protein